MIPDDIGLQTLLSEPPQQANVFQEWFPTSSKIYGWTDLSKRENVAFTFHGPYPTFEALKIRQVNMFSKSQLFAHPRMAWLIVGKAGNFCRGRNSEHDVNPELTCMQKKLS